MEHIEIENKIKQIRQSLIDELKSAGAVDESGKATDIKLFEYIIDSKVKEIKALEPLVVDESGVANDRYAMNIFMHNLEILNEMRKKHAINFDNNEYSLQQGAAKEEALFKKSLFKRALGRLNGRLRRTTTQKTYSR